MEQQAKKLVSIDIETYDPQLTDKGPGAIAGNGEILGISVCSYGGEPKFFHYQCWKDDYSKFKRFLEAIFEHPLIGANINYDLEWIYKTFGTLPKDKTLDIQVAERLLDEHVRSVSLENLARKYLDVGKNEEPLLREAHRLGIDPKNIKKDMRVINPQSLRDYALEDSRLPLVIFQKQQRLLKELDLWELFLLETDVLRIALDMRLKGIKFDKDAAVRNIKSTEIEQAGSAARLASLNAGEAVNPSAAKSIEKAFIKSGLDYQRTDKGNPTFTKAGLAAINHPLPKEILNYRRLSKTLEFLNSYVNDYEIDGRIHAQFHAFKSDENGTITGRFSSSRPNLQQVTKKGTLRSMFLPNAGHVWVSFDYSQQEPRLMAHFIIDRKLEGWQKVRDAYRDNPDLDFYVFSAESAGVSRDTGKIIVLATAYGRGIANTAIALNKTLEEAKTIRQSVFSQIPLQPLSWALQNEASSNGYITTYLKRRCRFNKFEHKEFDKKNKLYDTPIDFMDDNPGEAFKRAATFTALNYAIQGSAADMVKKAMVQIDKELGLKPIIQVHDELAFSLPKDDSLMDTIKSIKAIMENILPLHIPIKVDVSLGESWGKCEVLAV